MEGGEEWEGGEEGGRGGGREGQMKGGRDRGRKEEGGFGLWWWIKIQKRLRQFLLKAKLASERLRYIHPSLHIHLPKFD
jgi:hypothetical protein